MNRPTLLPFRAALACVIVTGIFTSAVVSAQGSATTVPANVVPQGVDIRTGVFDHRAGLDAATYIAIYLDLPEEAFASGPWNATITCPAGWNDDAPFDIPLSAETARTDRFIALKRTQF